MIPCTITFPSLLNLPAGTLSRMETKAIHAHAIKTRLLDYHVQAINNLLKLYTISGDISSARNLFDRIPHRDIVSWTTLIHAYTKSGTPAESICLFFQMLHTSPDTKPDQITLTVVLSACAALGDLQLARDLHTYINTNTSIINDIHLRNALISMYSKCGDIDTAYKLFTRTRPAERNIVTWNSIISGLTSNAKFKEALSLFRRMQRIGVKPDQVTLVAALNACANLGALDIGQWLHALITQTQALIDNRFITNALVDMYGKCGSIDRAHHVFTSIKPKHRDVYTYTSMITALAMHGQGEKASHLFADMLKAGIKPNRVTFIGILSACNHAGFVATGLSHFQSMSSIHNIEPQMEHYSCVADMLARAGLVQEALNFIKNMPLKPDAAMWSSLLSACRIHGNVSFAESIMRQVADNDNEDEDCYVLMSNIYTEARRGRDASSLRMQMRKKRKAKKKEPGCSLIEINGEVHEFKMGSVSHPQTKDIHLMLHSIHTHLKYYH
ncbi:putative tetratricopeptide-like helical domain superfamily [Dioscorea sansibarensis]